MDKWDAGNDHENAPGVLVAPLNLKGFVCLNRRSKRTKVTVKDIQKTEMEVNLEKK